MVKSLGVRPGSACHGKSVGHFEYIVHTKSVGRPVNEVEYQSVFCQFHRNHQGHFSPWAEQGRCSGCIISSVIYYT